MLFNPWDPSKPTDANIPQYQLSNNPTVGVAARYDLSPNKSLRKNNGAIDTKITNLSMSKQQMCVAISGPTHQYQIPFQWSLSNSTDPHNGQPDLWNFNW